VYYYRGGGINRVLRAGGCAIDPHYRGFFLLFSFSIYMNKGFFFFFFFFYAVYVWQESCLFVLSLSFWQKTCERALCRLIVNWGVNTWNRQNFRLIRVVLSNPGLDHSQNSFFRILFPLFWSYQSSPWSPRSVFWAMSWYDFYGCNHQLMRNKEQQKAFWHCDIVLSGRVGGSIMELWRQMKGDQNLNVRCNMVWWWFSIRV